jgi:hypothetical protein
MNIAMYDRNHCARPDIYKWKLITKTPTKNSI